MVSTVSGATSTISGVVSAVSGVTGGADAGRSGASTSRVGDCTRGRAGRGAADALDRGDRFGDGVGLERESEQEVDGEELG